ncbi:lipopolysaccharide biosynthesis protein [Streptococcus acidominimus]|uniref:Polysaccharide biosynthesis protein n=1 Tax=Streptococcus acidominimus TaxID=1326 RepID=A0A1Q8EE80_STRAI|nr:polysaccharide biosynthesis protein [Streptococcus acidominimus]OLF50063.1 polysaccharide biosynthesis protein [Streptococcus acidominimus]SUN08067.1 polysaccharide biosynthesis protein [Streptococcus acidominimus]
MKKRSSPTAKSVYMWNMLGNLAAAGVSVLYLLLVTRLTSDRVADQFSLAISIGNLWVIIGLFQVRNYQGTDITQRYSFTHYFFSRLWTIGIMLVTIIPYLYLIHYDLSAFSLSLLLLIILYRASDALSDVFQGLFQQNSRLDIAGKSMFFRYVFSVLIVWIGLLQTKSLILSLAVLAGFNLLFIVCYDYHYSHQFATIDWNYFGDRKYRQESFQVLKQCVSLFAYGFLLNQIFNEPRLVIAAGLRSGMLGKGLQRDYSILFMPVFFMSLCVLVIRPLITKLAVFWQERNMECFNQIVKKIVLVLSGISIFVVGVTFLIGPEIMTLVFGVDLYSYRLTLTLLVFSGFLYALATVFENILIIFRQHPRLFFVYIPMFACSKCITFAQVMEKKLLGAAVSFMMTMVIYVVGTYIIFYYFKKKGEKNGKSLV